VQVSSIAEQLLFATVRIETVDIQGDKGVGTGFFFGVERNGRQYGFLVTNKHVIKNTSTGKILFTLAENKQPLLGKTYWLNITNFGDWWHSHSDPEVDIAIAPIGGAIKAVTDKGVSVYHTFIHENLIPDAKQVEEFDAIEEIVFVGYPNNIWDDLNNLPVTRRGITATPLAVDFRGKKQFLIDGSVFPGSSGSPVFVLRIGSYSTKSGNFIVGNKLAFVGIVSSVFFRRAEGKIEMTEAPTAMVPVPVSQEMIDLGLVIKSSVVIEVIEQFLGLKGKEEAKPVTTAMRMR
jgi:hypothetical protein